MKQTIAILAACAALMTAWADDVTVKDTPVYSNAKVTGLTGLKLEFKTSGGNTISKDLKEVQTIKITEQESFNQAEDLVGQGKFAEAVKAYSTALDRAGDDWLKQLITIRRLRALGNVGPVDKAVKDWLALVGDNGAAALPLAPKKAGEKGSEANKQAIKLLEEAAAAKKGAELTAIQRVLLAVYEAEEMKAEANKLKAALGTTVQPEEEPNAPMGSGAAAAILRESVEVLNKDPKAALEKIHAKINAFEPGDLPEALMIAARAQQAMAAKIKDPKDAERKRLLAAAGLDYMRVYVFYPVNASAAEALLQAGECCKQLGNNLAAKTAYQALVTDFPKSDQAKKAQAALAAMEQ